MYEHECMSRDVHAHWMWDTKSRNMLSFWARLGELVVQLCHAETSFDISIIVAGVTNSCSISLKGFLVLYIKSTCDSFGIVFSKDPRQQLSSMFLRLHSFHQISNSQIFNGFLPEEGWLLYLPVYHQSANVRLSGHMASLWGDEGFILLCSQRTDSVGDCSFRKHVERQWGSLSNPVWGHQWGWGDSLCP